MAKTTACPSAAGESANMTNGSKVPQVIVTAVFDTIDRGFEGFVRLQMLSAACLVSRDWCRLAQPFLYRRLLLCLRTPPTHANNSFPLLSVLLGNRRLGRLVHELVLHLEHASAVAAATVFTLFRDFTKLRRLSLTVRHSKATAIATHLQLLQSLQHLAIAGAWTKTLANAVYRLPGLKSLQLSSYPPEAAYLPTFELRRLIADIELVPSTFYRLTMLSCVTLTTLVLAISDICPPVDLSYCVALRSLSFVAPAEPLRAAELAAGPDPGVEEHGGGEWSVEVVKSAKNLRRLTFLSLRCADGATTEMWEDLPHLAIDFLQSLPRSIEALDLAAVSFAFELDDLEHLVFEREERTPALHTLYLGKPSPAMFGLWGCGQFSFAVYALAYEVRVIFSDACDPVPPAGVCTF
ncbi:hypothetical protein JCM3774_005877 [Rhodotorula dairenensis]